MQRQFASAILRNTKTPLIAVNEAGDILEVTAPAAKLFGYERNELLNCSLSALLPPEMRLRHMDFLQAFASNDDNDLSMGRRGTVRGYKKDGATFPLAASISKFRDAENGWIFVAILRDMQIGRLAEEELEWRTNHDALTGLPNRSLILQHLKQSHGNANRSGARIGILVINLDWFNLINDAFGYAEGDGLLTDASARIRHQIRPGDLIGRLGGDEFIVICESPAAEQELVQYAEAITDALRAPFFIQKNEVFQNCSIGVALSEPDTTTEQLLANANAAMRRAKSSGQSTWRLHEIRGADHAQRQLSIVNWLRTAVARDEFYPVFQPIVHSSTGVTHGFELLARWRTPGGEISPAEFIPIAERCGTIGQIGDWSFTKACQMRTRLRLTHGMAAPYVSVNLSVRQLQDGTLAKRFRDIACREGADRGGIQIEITESVLMTEIADARGLIEDLSRLGFRIAIDDFGAGYSSLAQILRFPVDAIKVDKELVQNLPSDAGSRTIAKAIRNIATETGKELILEGIEDEHQRRHVEEMDCNLMQGFYFSRPMREQSIDAFLEKFPPKSARPF
jgi:diguanylate cyclase (GGDEF)-like protein/PAS domain S-box-containing protein